MSPFAYSDLVNHAFAYAAVHHAQQQRKGTRLPYITHLANVAVILARYGLDERTIAAAILHDVVEDCEDHSQDVHANQIEAKFGRDVLETVLSVTKPRTNEHGEALDSAQGKERYLEQLHDAGRSAHWVSAADKLHNARCILSDLERADPTEVWARFNVPRGESVAFYRRVYETLRDTGFREPIMSELEATIEQLEIKAR
jgi:(p)ppGpp synthase/HD superfamily hydrolase